MEFRPLAIPDVVLVIPDVHRDDRGFFLETWHLDKYVKGGVDARFVQTNQSRTGHGALRGLHAQLVEPQGKLVRAIAGEIFDVAVDARIGSPTYGQHVSAMLTGENHHQLWVPPGFLHGFCVVSERADVEYQCTAVWNKDGEIAVAWNDPEIGVPWPVAEPVVSDRDAAAPPLAALRDRLPHWSTS